METLPAGESLIEGMQAMERADWESARVAFEAVLETGESADARDGLGQALWFLGDVAGGIAMRERAFEEYVRARRCDDAARMAVWVSHQHLTAGRASAARGWLARSERALDGVGGCAGHGWVAVERARHTSNAEEQIAHARRAMDIARANGADDLEVFALSLLGRAEVNAGHREQGMALLEEAMAAATAGRVRNIHTLAEAYCNLIDACAAAGEWERANEWCELVDEFSRTHATAPLFGACRTVHADVLMAAGRWPEAEHALETALATHARYVPALSEPTLARMGELRVRQGRLAEAAQLLAGVPEQPSSLRALALLRLAEERPQAAAALLERGLRGTEGSAVHAALLLAPLADARLACADVAGAREAAGRAGRARPGVRHPAHRRPRRPRRRPGGDRRGRRGRGGRVRPARPGRLRRARDAVRRRAGAPRARARDRRRHAGGRRRRGSRRARHVPRARGGPGRRRRRRARCASSAARPAGAAASPAS